MCKKRNMRADSLNSSTILTTIGIASRTICDNFRSTTSMREEVAPQCAQTHQGEEHHLERRLPRSKPPPPCSILTLSASTSSTRSSESSENTSSTNAFKLSTRGRTRSANSAKASEIASSLPTELRFSHTSSTTGTSAHLKLISKI